MVGVVVTEILGWLMYIAISFATYSIPDILQSKLPLPVGDIFLAILGKKGALTLWWSIALLQVSGVYRVPYVHYLSCCSTCVDAPNASTHHGWFSLSPGTMHSRVQGGGRESTAIHRHLLTLCGL
jgi:hypothetical protein